MFSDSLEDRMEHYAKRRKISTTPSTEETWWAYQDMDCTGLLWYNSVGQK